MNDSMPHGWDCPQDEHDEKILLGLRELWSDADRPPEFLVDQVRLSLRLVDLDAEVLRLVDTQRLTAARGEVHTRRITFSDDDLTVMIGVDPNPDGTVRVDGWLAPGQACRVELCVGSQCVSAMADQDGRFAVPRAPRGMTRLVVHQVTELSRTVTTPTVEL